MKMHNKRCRHKLPTQKCVAFKKPFTLLFCFCFTDVKKCWRILFEYLTVKVGGKCGYIWKVIKGDK